MCIKERKERNKFDWSVFYINRCTNMKDVVKYCIRYLLRKEKKLHRTFILNRTNTIIKWMNTKTPTLHEFDEMDVEKTSMLTDLSFLESEGVSIIIIQN